MRILFIAQYFPPEMGALASRISELAEVWAAEGAQVTVLTGFPNYPSGVVPEEYKDKLRRLLYKEEINGYQVVRTWLTTLSNDRAGARVLGYLSFFLSSLLTGLFLAKPDVIIASSPPLTVGLSGWLISKIRRIPFVFEIRDLWPESITASGVSSGDSALIRTLAGMAKFLYKNSGQFVVVSPAFKEVLQDRHQVPAERIKVIPNGVKTDLFSEPRDPEQARKELGLENKLTVSYIGNFGWAQGLQTVLEAAKILRASTHDLRFLFVGGGADEDKLKAFAAEADLECVQFIPPQPKERIPEYIQASDICLVPLRDEPVFETAIPSKMLEFMAGSRPVILAVRGQAREILLAARSGLDVPPENPEELAKAVLQLVENSTQRREMGERGSEYVRLHYNRHGLALDYLDNLRKYLN